MVIGVNANGASISPDPRIARDYSQPVHFTLTAPDGTKAVYSVTVKGGECLPTPAPTPEPTPTPTPVDPAPVAAGAFAALTDMTIGDNLGMPIVPTINAGGVTDPLGRTIVYTATGLPTGFVIDSSTGVISGSYDTSPSETFNVTIKAQANGSTQFISKTFALTINDE